MHAAWRRVTTAVSVLIGIGCQSAETRFANRRGPSGQTVSAVVARGV